MGEEKEQFQLDFLFFIFVSSCNWDLVKSICHVNLGCDYATAEYFLISLGILSLTCELSKFCRPLVRIATDSSSKTRFNSTRLLKFLRLRGIIKSLIPCLVEFEVVLLISQRWT